MSWDGAVRLVKGGTTPWEGDGQVKFTNDVRCASWYNLNSVFRVGWLSIARSVSVLSPESGGDLRHTVVVCVLLPQPIGFRSQSCLPTPDFFGAYFRDVLLVLVRSCTCAFPAFRSIGGRHDLLAVFRLIHYKSYQREPPSAHREATKSQTTSESPQVTSLVAQLPHGGLGADLPPGDRERLPACQGRDGHAGQRRRCSDVCSAKGGIWPAIEGFDSSGKPSPACERRSFFQAR